MTRRDTSLRGAALLLVLAGFTWQAVTWAGLTPAYVLPVPVDVALVLRENITMLLEDVAVTLANAMLGLAIGGMVASTLAVAMLYLPPLRRSLVPLLAGFEAVPKIALAPLLVVWLGIGATSKVALAAALTFYPLFINFLSGLENVDPHLLELSRVLRAGRARTLWLVRLPSSLIQAFDAMRIAVPLSLIGALLGEFISADRGLGYRLLTAYAQLRTDLAFAVLSLIALISMVLYGLVGLLERATLKWKE
jgi:ABC-type nitrate/sulfonate/bicarbonate transport system permease component